MVSTLKVVKLITFISKHKPIDLANFLAHVFIGRLLASRAVGCMAFITLDCRYKPTKTAHDV
jgi:hypothetical protein